MSNYQTNSSFSNSNDNLRYNSSSISESIESKCHKECLEVKSRTARLRVKPGIDDQQIENAFKYKSNDRLTKLNNQFQHSIDSYLQVIKKHLSKWIFAEQFFSSNKL